MPKPAAAVAAMALALTTGRWRCQGIDTATASLLLHQLLQPRVHWPRAMALLRSRPMDSQPHLAEAEATPAAAAGAEAEAAAAAAAEVAGEAPSVRLRAAMHPQKQAVLHQLQ